MLSLGEREIFCRRSATSFPHRGASGITVGRGSPFIKRGGAPLRIAGGGVPAGNLRESLMCLHGLPPRRGISNPRGPSLSTATYGAGGTDNGRDDRRRCRWQLEHSSYVAGSALAATNAQPPALPLVPQGTLDCCYSRRIAGALDRG